MEISFRDRRVRHTRRGHNLNVLFYCINATAEPKRALLCSGRPLVPSRCHRVPHPCRSTGPSLKHWVMATLRRCHRSFEGNMREWLQFSGFSKASSACLRPKQTTQKGCSSFVVIRVPNVAEQACDEQPQGEVAGLESDISAKNHKKSE